jgi:hypothetical protein
LNLKQATL